jgi:hypothetical protein
MYWIVSWRVGVFLRRVTFLLLTAGYPPILGSPYSSSLLEYEYAPDFVTSRPPIQEEVEGLL